MLILPVRRHACEPSLNFFMTDYTSASHTDTDNKSFMFFAKTIIKVSEVCKKLMPDQE